MFAATRFFRAKAMINTMTQNLTRSASSQGQSAWNPQVYLTFSDERTTPVRELISKIPLESPRRIIDLGCGPGNSTAVLAERYPDAEIRGMDSSLEMLDEARKVLPNLNFFQADLTTYTPNPQEFDLIFSNAAFQWLPKEQRVPLMKRLLEHQDSGSVLAFQVPDNTYEPSHQAMSSVKGPWTPIHEAHGSLSNAKFPEPTEIYNALKPICSTVTVFHINYNHVLKDHEAIVKWVQGTGLRPFVDVLPKEIKDEYLAAYLKELKSKYSKLCDGKVMLRYPRLFVIATKS